MTVWVPEPIPSTSAADSVVANSSILVIGHQDNVDTLLRLDSATDMFVRDTSAMPQEYIETTLAMFVDYDGDCDVDILTFGVAPFRGGSGPILYSNLDRQVEQTKRVRIGHDMKIDLHNDDPFGTTPTLWYYVGVSTPATQPIPTAFGPFWLNPATLIVLPMVEVASDSTQTLTIPFPNRSVLQGRDIIIQALVVDPNRLLPPFTYASNLLGETIGGG